MIVYERYAALIKHLASCNGTGRAELDCRVDHGELAKDDAEIVWFYACCRKLTETTKDIIS